MDLLLEAIVQAAWRRDSLILRSLVQELIRQQPQLAQLPPPATANQQHLALAAALVELIASRMGQEPPPWTASVGVAPEAFYLVAAAEYMPRLRQHCETEAPPPLRRRHLYAPADFLSFA